MHETDYRSEPDYRPFLRAVRRRMRVGMNFCETIRRHPLAARRRGWGASPAR